jgi:murein DD-endopeptidase MepM/ murein hydrolase activator NlpD
MNDLELLLKIIENITVIDSSIAYTEYMSLDLSVSNVALSKLDLDNAIDFENFIENRLTLNNAKVAYGGYNEERNLYKRSLVFKNSKTEERNIHIGLDLWIKAGTKVLAAIDGKVHSFQNNTDLGDYGPTIILEHTIEGQIFYTLYGHLSLESIDKLEIGTFFSKGEQLATLGYAPINGNYAPHLHFQIIKDIEGNFGDYPGVCSKSKREFYLKNCPDPNLLLKIK